MATSIWLFVGLILSAVGFIACLIADGFSTETRYKIGTVLILLAVVCVIGMH